MIYLILSHHHTISLWIIRKHFAHKLINTHFGSFEQLIFLCSFWNVIVEVCLDFPSAFDVHKVTIMSPHRIGSKYCKKSHHLKMLQNSITRWFHILLVTHERMNKKLFLHFLKTNLESSFHFIFNPFIHRYVASRKETAINRTWDLGVCDFHVIFFFPQSQRSFV